MKKRSKRSRMVRAMMAIMIGGTAFQTSGCDPNVRSTVLTGLESTATTLTTALIQAYFLTLQGSSTSTL